MKPGTLSASITSTPPSVMPEIVPVTTSPFLHGGHALLERIGFELLDAEADALLVDIDVEHLDPHHLALAVILDRVLAGPVPVDVGQVDHAVDVAGQADEQAELGDVAHLALDGAADRVLLDEGVPRVRP